jgi:hypothetical protein
MKSPQIFILSPARLDGRRGKLLLNPEARSPLAATLRAEGAPIGEVFSFLSGLYFRGKLSYAKTFASPPTNIPGVLVITTSRGLRPPDDRVYRRDLAEFAHIDLATPDERFHIPLRRDIDALRRRIGDDTRVVLLGSIATGKYVDPLLGAFGERLMFPADFVGRGDMSRGGLLLRCVSDGRELGYVSVSGAQRRGARPPRLAPRKRPELPGQLHRK